MITLGLFNNLHSYPMEPSHGTTFLLGFRVSVSLPSNNIKPEDLASLGQLHGIYLPLTFFFCMNDSIVYIDKKSTMLYSMNWIVLSSNIPGTLLLSYFYSDFKCSLVSHTFNFFCWYFVCAVTKIVISLLARFYRNDRNSLVVKEFTKFNNYCWTKMQEIKHTNWKFKHLAFGAHTYYLIHIHLK